MFYKLFTKIELIPSLSKEEQDELKKLIGEQQGIEASIKKLSPMNQDKVETYINLVNRLREIKLQKLAISKVKDPSLGKLIADKFQYHEDNIECRIFKSSNIEQITITDCEDPTIALFNLSAVIKNNIPSFKAKMDGGEATPCIVVASFSLNDRNRVIALFNMADNLCPVKSATTSSLA